MATFDTGQPSFSLQAAKIAKNNGDGTFGTAVTVPSVKILGIDLKTISDQAQGDSRITATASQAISVDVQFDFAGITFGVLEILTGLTHSSSGAAGTLENYLTMDNFRFPYWGIIGQAWAAEASGDTLVFLPKCKVMSGLAWRLEFGKIVTPSFKGTAIYDDYFLSIIEVVERATVAAIAIPPT